MACWWFGWFSEGVVAADWVFLSEGAKSPVILRGQGCVVVECLGRASDEAVLQVSLRLLGWIRIPPRFRLVRVAGFVELGTALREGAEFGADVSLLQAEAEDSREEEEVEEVLLGGLVLESFGASFGGFGEGCSVAGVQSLLWEWDS